MRRIIGRCGNGHGAFAEAKAHAHLSPCGLVAAGNQRRQNTGAAQPPVRGTNQPKAVGRCRAADLVPAAAVDLKVDEGGRTVTRVRLLSPDERVIEVARMLAGEVVTEPAMANARELLGSGATHPLTE